MKLSPWFNLKTSSMIVLLGWVKVLQYIVWYERRFYSSGCFCYAHRKWWSTLDCEMKSPLIARDTSTKCTLLDPPALAWSFCFLLLERNCFYHLRTVLRETVPLLYNCGRILFILSFFILDILSFRLVRLRTFRFSAWVCADINAGVHARAGRIWQSQMSQ